MISDSEMVIRLVVAAVLGSVVGFERERQNWAAGLRTHMLVCVGAALIMLVSIFGFADVAGMDGVDLDPSRVAAQVVSGIGFLGAGAIIMRNEIVRGLTTAASLWAVAGLGLAVGGGMYTAAISSTVLIVIILAGIKPLERRFITARQERKLQLLVEPGSLTLDSLRRQIGPIKARIEQFVVRRSDEAQDIDEVSIIFARATDEEYELIWNRVQQIAGIRERRRDR